MTNQETLRAEDKTADEPNPEVIPSVGVSDGDEVYRVWASDNQVYGPISLTILTEWIHDSRVFRDTWIYLESLKSWKQASAIPQLKEALVPGEDTLFLEQLRTSEEAVNPNELRVFPALAALSNHDLAQFIKLSELVLVNSGEFVIRRHEPGDAIFFVLAGTVRVRILVGRDEKVLGRISSGQFLGEISMFTQTPRSADIIAEEDARLLRFTAESFRALMLDNPGAAAPMLYSISATLAQRILDTNQKFQTEVASGFVWR